MLWSYQSLDDRTRIRKEAQQLEEWVEAGKAQVFRFIFCLVLGCFLLLLVCKCSMHHDMVQQELR